MGKERGIENGREVEYFDPTYKEQFQCLREGRLFIHEDGRVSDVPYDAGKVLANMAKYLKPIGEKK